MEIYWLLIGLIVVILATEFQMDITIIDKTPRRELKKTRKDKSEK